MGISFLQNATGVVNINDYPPPSLHNLHINIHHQWIFGLDWLRMNDEPDVKSELVWYRSKCVFWWFALVFSYFLDLSQIHNLKSAH